MLKINKTKLKFSNRAIKDDKLSLNGKYVLLCLEYVHKVINKNNLKAKRNQPITVTYDFMYKRFGVSSRIYKKALDELKKKGFITVRKPRTTAGNRINRIAIKTPQVGYELFENVFVTTPVYTPMQKAFIGLFVYTLSSISHFESGKSSLSEYVIKKKMLELGVPETTTETRLKELTYLEGEKSKLDCIALFVRHENGYSLNKQVLLALYKLDHELMGEAQYEYQKFNAEGSRAANLYSYPVYKKGDIKLFKWDEESCSIIRKK